VCVCVCVFLYVCMCGVFLYSDVKKAICGISNIKHACHKKVMDDRNILVAILNSG
jgi:hypothetical protein